MNKTDLQHVLHESINAVIEHGRKLSGDAFVRAPEGKWSTGQQVDHLIRSTKPLNTALRLPKFLPRLLFGTASRPSRAYDEIAAAYQQVLDAGGKASGPYVAGTVTAADHGRLLDAYAREQRRLDAALSRWDESALDRYRLPHPLLGKLTVREMLLFTVRHNRHHLESMERL